MNLFTDENGQGAAEYILIFGGVIVIAIVAILMYRTYISSGNSLKVSQDISKVRGSVR